MAGLRAMAGLFAGRLGGFALRSQTGPMKILLAVAGSAYTRRMLASIAAHDEWLGARHHYTVIYCVAPLRV